MNRYMDRKKMSDEERIEWIKNSLGAALPEIPKNERTDKEKAEDMAFDILEAIEENGIQLEWEDVKELETKAKQALELCNTSPLVYEAYYKACLSNEKASKILDKGLEASELLFGGDYEKENMGHFWGLIETRPYIRLLGAKGLILEEQNKKKEAAEIFNKILTLNPQDNSGVRNILQRLYLDLKDYDAFVDLIDQFEDEFEHSLHSLYNYALYCYMTGDDCEDADEAMFDALDFNPFVLPYLLGKKQIPKQPISRFSPNAEDGAMVYIQETLSLWRKQVGIQKWLREFED